MYITTTNTSEPADACSPLPDDTPNLAGKLVVVRRGECEFNIKEKNVAAKGAQYLLFYTDERPVNMPFITKPSVLEYGTISAETGAYIVNSIVSQKKTTVYFPPPGRITVQNKVTGGSMSTFNSWGPTWEGLIKPEIGAPGGDILSTYPVSLGSYKVLSGTSMAAPYVAGVAALYYGKYGGRAKMGPNAAIELKKRIISSGKIVHWSDGTGIDNTTYAPIAQQGGGYINATKVLEYSTSISPAKLELNDTPNFKPGHSIEVKNSGNKTVIYAVSHIPALSFNSFQEGYAMPTLFPPDFVSRAASVTFSKVMLRVHPGATGTFKATFAPPQGLDADLIPVYGGKIVVTGSNGEVLQIPYLGIVGSLKSKNMWDISWNIPEFSGPDGALKYPANFTKGLDLPTITYINDWGAREVRIDLVSFDWEESHFYYPPVAGKHKFIGSMITESGSRYPAFFVPRSNLLSPYDNYVSSKWSGNVTVGTEANYTVGTETIVAPPGQYKFNMRALKIGGNPKLASDWQSVTSPVFTVLGEPKASLNEED